MPASSRHMEDFVTWVDTSKLKRTVARYNDEVCALLSGAGETLSAIWPSFKLDDFDLL